MIGNILAALLLLVAVLALCVGIRAAWRTRRPLVRWPVAIVGGAVALLGFLAFGASVRGMLDVYPKVGRPVQAMTIEPTPDRIERGRQIAGNWCAACHSLNGQLPLSGGKDIAKEIPPPIGALPTANLTPGGRIKDWSDGEIFRAVREGVDPQGNKLLVMSGQYARYLSDDDLKAVIAFLRTQPAVHNPMPPERLSFLGVVMAGASMFPRIKEEPPVTVTAPPPGPTAAYGEYMVSWMNCRECHGPRLQGTTGGVLPPSPSLRVSQTWTAEQFLTAMRTGKTPHGKQLDSLKMPWNFVGRFSDDEILAIHAYLRTAEIPLPAK